MSDWKNEKTEEIKGIGKVKYEWKVEYENVFDVQIQKEELFYRKMFINMEVLRNEYE